MSAPAPAAASLSSSASSVGQQSALSLTQSQSHKRPRDDGGEGEQDEKRQPPAARAVAARAQLHRHALESIFACLDIAGLATALAVSRDWQAAVGSMRSISSSKLIASNAHLQQLVSSRLRRHVTAVRFTADCPVTVAVIALLTERMPHLLLLSCSDFIIAAGVESIQWPPKLQELTLLRHDREIGAPVAEANMLMRSIGRLTQLRSLTLSLQFHASLAFAPLAALSLLRRLEVKWRHHDRPHLSDAQVDEIRMLVDVDDISLSMSQANTSRLLRPPHALRWRQVPSAFAADDAMCALLPGLSCLTELNVYGVSCTDFDWLPRMQSLSDMKVGLSSDHPTAAAATQSLMAALQHCPRITSLTLDAWRMPITSEQLSACLTAMPSLSTLHIERAQLPSLSFLAAPSLALSLHVLRLHFLCKPKPPVSELRHLHGLQSLRQLTLDYALASPLDSATLTAFTPPSALLSQLKTFFVAPVGDPAWMAH